MPGAYSEVYGDKRVVETGLGTVRGTTKSTSEFHGALRAGHCGIGSVSVWFFKRIFRPAAVLGNNLFFRNQLEQTGTRISREQYSAILLLNC